MRAEWKLKIFQEQHAIGQSKTFIVIEEPDEIIQDHMAVSELASQDFQPGVDIVEIFKRDWKEKLIYL